jgi:hypothetical protein
MTRLSIEMPFWRDGCGPELDVRADVGNVGVPAPLGLHAVRREPCDDRDALSSGKPLELTLSDSDLCFDCAASFEEGEDDEAWSKVLGSAIVWDRWLTATR